MRATAMRLRYSWTDVVLFVLAMVLLIPIMVELAQQIAKALNE